MDTEKKLQIKNLSCVRQQYPLFTDLSFELSPGELVVIEGENGSGKSSLLRIVAGLTTPASGQIIWNSEDIYKSNLVYKENMHYVGHANGIKLGLTVTENLQLTNHLNLQNTQNNFSSVLTLLKLQPDQYKQAKYLSAGQRRRVALAKLFLLPKLVWLLDEPCTSLDANTQAIFYKELEKHLQRGGVAIISSHHTLPLNASIIRLSRHD